MFRKLSVISLILFIFMSVPAFAESSEFRGVWITAWTHGFLTRSEADETLRMAKKAHINTILVQVRKVGDAYYNSNYEPRKKLSDPEYDPLAYMIQKGHEQGFKIYAWINTFRIASSLPYPDPKHVTRLHPEWICKKSDGSVNGSGGVFLDPGIPGVQDWTMQVVMDIIKNYDVDGINLDYIRYAGPNWGYSKIAVDRFNQEMNRTGTPSINDPQWCDWRRGQITGLVQRIYKAAKAEKSKVQVTADVITWGRCPKSFTQTSAYSHVFQDWKTWTESGIVDQVLPMNYAHGTMYSGWIDGFKKWSVTKKTITGIDFDSGTNHIASEIQLARDAGLTGICGFAFNQRATRANMAQKLQESVFQQ